MIEAVLSLIQEGYVYTSDAKARRLYFTEVKRWWIWKLNLK